MTDGVKLSYYEGIQKHKECELKNSIYNEFKQFRWFETINYSSKRIQIFSGALEIGVQIS